MPEAVYKQAQPQLHTEDPKEVQQMVDPYGRAFEMIAEEVKDRVISGLEVLQMSDVLKQFVQLLGDFGIEQPEYRSEKLKKRLKKEFSDQISFWHPRFRRDSELIFSDVPPGIIVEAGVAASSKLRDDETADELQLGEDMPNQAAREAYHVSQLLHRAIMQVKDMPWPTLPEHITTEAAEAAIPTPSSMSWPGS